MAKSLCLKSHNRAWIVNHKDDILALYRSIPYVLYVKEGASAIHLHIWFPSFHPEMSLYPKKWGWYSTISLSKLASTSKKPDQISHQICQSVKMRVWLSEAWMCVCFRCWRGEDWAGRNQTLWWLCSCQPHSVKLHSANDCTLAHARSHSRCLVSFLTTAYQSFSPLFCN